MKEEINILFAGDYSPVGRVNELAIKQKYNLIFNDLLEIISESDISIVSLECSLGEVDKSIKKYGPSIKVDKVNINALKFAGFDIVSLANNHIMDFGTEGLRSTIQACKDADIQYLGVGNTLAEARKVIYKTINEKKIAFLNFAENEFSTTHNDSPGANPIDPINNLYDIKRAKLNSDFVFVIVHGGIEGYKYPSPNLKKLFHFYVDAGANAVICSHAHCFSGYEVYNNSTIFYGLGNFVFDWFVTKDKMQNSPWNYGYLVKFSITSTVKFEIIPYIQCSVLPGVFQLDSFRRKSFFEEIEVINSVILKDPLIEDKFNNISNNKKKFYKLALNPYLDFIYRILLKFFPDCFFISKRKKLLLLNIIRCESHREILLNILKRD